MSFTTSRVLRPRAARRGQALVLLSLTMLLVTLMVLMTLGISSRVKEKMEVQQVADAASYSTAVATSRAMNTIALLNRVHVATMVALAANQSLISWTGLYRGALHELREGSRMWDWTCAVKYCRPSCRELKRIRNKIDSVEQQVASKWNAPDAQAGEQSRNFQKSVSGVQKVTLESLRDDLVKEQKLAKKIISLAAEGDPHSEWEVATRGDAVTLGEHKWFEDSADQSKPQDDDALFLVPRRETRELAVEATHGTRGEAFVSSRKNFNHLIATKLSGDLGKLVAPGGADGEGWFGNEASSGEAGKSYGTSPRAAVAADRASYTMAFPAPPCVPFINGSGVEASVFSDDRTQSNNDEHKWSGSTNADDEPPTQRHTMGGCTACPGVWTGFIDLNPAQVKQERRWETLYGQPKVMAALERDYSKRTKPDPWALDFKFGLTGKEKQFDNRGEKTTDGTNISRQYAVSTAISYYHRPGGHWEEPPNFFNPFWRATLVSPGVDNHGHPNPQGPRAHGAVGGDDLSKLLNGLPNGSTGAEVVKKLAEAGFQGWQ